QLGESTRGALRKKTVSTKNQIFVVDPIHAISRDGHHPGLQPFDPPLLTQIPEVKFKIVRGTPEHFFELNDSHSSSSRVSTPSDIEQGQDSFEDPFVAVVAFRI